MTFCPIFDNPDCDYDDICDCYRTVDCDICQRVMEDDV